MSKSLKSKIINTLIESFQISKKDIDEAIELQKSKGISLDKALIEKGLFHEEDLMVLLVKELHIPFINLKKYKIDPTLKGVVPEKTARQYRIIPLSQMENTITVATSDPLNIFAFDDLKSITGNEIDVVMSTETDIAKAIDSYYGSSLSNSVQDLKEIAAEDFEIVVDKGGEESGDALGEEGDQAPVIRIVNLIIKEGLKQRASDIHVEPMADHIRVRYRVDGVLLEAMKIPKESQNAVIVRIKIMSRMDITVTRTPQDGRFKMRVAGQEIDFRVSLLPTTFGQKIVLRILDKKNLKIGLGGLGFSGKSLEVLEKGIRAPFGMILVTGPTGSGKSTTLYSIINELNTVEKNIITVEDPVEYLINGLTQIQVRPDIGMTFASGLRAILRQSPDIVMVGEIRDVETADIAIKASLTGQMVFSTLHTNDAASTLTRLIDMGIEPFLVASSLVLVCAQRLFRKICPKCKMEEDIHPDVLQRFGINVPPGTKFYKGKGCHHCRQTGYFGRIGITEVLEMDEVVRDMLIRGESTDTIKKYATEKKGMSLLYEDIMQRFRNGETTLEEVWRVTSAE